MPDRRDTPQLSLEFEADDLCSSHEDQQAPKSNVVRLAVPRLRDKCAPRTNSFDDADSVLEEVLSNARRLNW